MRFPLIEVAIDIDGSLDQNCCLILEVRPWRSINCSFQGLPATETAVNFVKVACKENVRCADQSKVATVVCHPRMVGKLSMWSMKGTTEDAVNALALLS